MAPRIIPIAARTARLEVGMLQKYWKTPSDPSRLTPCRKKGNLMIHSKHKGSRGELAACVWLMDNGYEVFRNVSSHGIIDIIAMRGSEALFLDVKSKPIRASKEQLDAGVKWITPLPGGGFSIFTPNPILANIPCEVCGRPLTGRRTRRWCSQTCRNATQRSLYAIK